MSVDKFWRSSYGICINGGQQAASPAPPVFRSLVDGIDGGHQRILYLKVADEPDGSDAVNVDYVVGKLRDVTAVLSVILHGGEVYTLTGKPILQFGLAYYVLPVTAVGLEVRNMKPDNVEVMIGRKGPLQTWDWAKKPKLGKGSRISFVARNLRPPQDGGTVPRKIPFDFVCELVITYRLGAAAEITDVYE